MAKDILKQELDKAEATNAVAWAISNELKNENNSPIEFEDHAFLLEPYMDNTPKQAIMKAAQIGWSVLAIIRSFHLARFAGANIIHTFPSRNMAKDFVIPKVNPLIENNKVIKKMIETDSLNLKEIDTPYGKRFIYYRGSYEKTEAISISAHILINDEFDRSNQEVLKTYRSRLDDAKRERPELGWEWRFSNPTIPGYGVHELWEKSDQKHWFVKCSHCGKWQYLKFPESIDFERKVRACKKCNKELTRKDLIDGRWVKKYKNRDVSGYWISQMIVPWISAEKIIEDSEGDKEIFHNFTLGRPYVAKDASVTRQSIIDCLAPGYNPQDNVAIGVDNGVTKNYVIGNSSGIFRIGETDDWGEIERLRNQYGATMVIDALPYPNVPNKLVEKYSGKVFIHYYQHDQKDAGVLNWDYDEGVVKADRTKIIDFVVADINAKDINYNMNAAELDEYIQHWKNMYRVVEENRQHVLVPKWNTIEGRPDHYAHATVLWRIALEQTLDVGGSIVKSSVQEKPKDRHPEANSDKEVAALDLDEVVDRAMKEEGSKGWKTI